MIKRHCWARPVLGGVVLTLYFTGPTVEAQTEDSIFINCGGNEFVDTVERVWTEDSTANPSPFLTSPPVNTAGGQSLPDLTFDENIADSLFPGEIFQDERWNDGPVEYTITDLDPDKPYDVHLLFREHCCSDGCLSGDPGADVCEYVSEDDSPPALDPQSVSSTCRIFNIRINDQIVRESWSKNLWAACIAGTAPGAPSHNIGVSVLTEGVEPSGGAIRILIEDLGGGNPPENASIKGIAIVESGTPIVPPDVVLPIPEINCLKNAQSGVDVTWTLPDVLTADIEISLQGDVIDSVDATTTSYTIAAAELDGLSTAEICVQPVGALVPTCCGVLLREDLYINCGGEEFVDGEDRVWTEDSAANPSLFLTSPPVNTAGGQSLPDLTWDENIADSLFPGEIFQDERWNNGPVEYTIPLGPGRYDVHLLFREHCCSDGCIDGDPGADVCEYVSEDDSPPALDPQTVSSSCRIFNLLINDKIVRENWSKSLWAACIAGTAPGAPSYNIGVSVLTEGVEPVDGAIKILIEDLGGTNPPENASIKGIAVIQTEGGPPPGASLKPGDANGDANFNLSDPVAHLNFLFNSGPLPDCYVVPDSDPPELSPVGLEVLDFNGDGSVNLADAVGGLNRLFAGGGSHVLGERCVAIQGDCASNCVE